MNNHHASCVAFGRSGVLIRGASGSGKSTLALQLIDGEGFGLGQKRLRATLVADDQVILQQKLRKLIASPPPALAGLIEIRGVGILPAKFKKFVTVKLVVELLPASSIQRLPNSKEIEIDIEGVLFPRIAIAAHDTAAAAILRAALHSVM